MDVVQQPGGGESWSMLECPTTVTIVRGQTSRASFAVAAGTLELKILDPDGAPAPELRVRLHPGTDWLPPTDELGVTRQTVTAGNVTLRVLPRRLRDEKAKQELYRAARAAGLADPFTNHWITIGEVVIQAGQTIELEVRLPPVWGR